MRYFQRLEHLRASLRAIPGLDLHADDLQPGDGELDEEHLEDLRDDGELELDDAMLAFFAEVGSVNIRWSLPQPGGRVMVGRIQLPSIDDIVFNTIEAIGDGDLSSADERALLESARMIWWNDGNDFLVFRTADGAVPSLWRRINHRDAALDVRLELSFGAYLEHLLATAGLLHFELPHVDGASVRVANAGPPSGAALFEAAAVQQTLEQARSTLWEELSTLAGHAGFEVRAG